MVNTMGINASDGHFKYILSGISKIQSPWTLAEFRHNRIVQSPDENYFNVCRQHKEK